MAPVGWNRMRWLAAAVALVVGAIVPLSSAARPGGEGVTLTTSGSVVQADGTTVEEYELRETDPTMAHFISLGTAAQKLLNKSGYAYGSLVGITHSDRDKEYGEGPERTVWFPMVVVLDVFEEGAGEEGEDVTSRYEVALEYRPKTITAPGLVILEARKLRADGEVEARLDLLPAEPMGFLEKNRAGITMMFGVIIASGIVKFLRRNIEKLVKKAKQDREGSEESTAAPAAPAAAADGKPSATARGKSTDNPKKKKAGGAKQD
ncbi:unnamed protein product [Scytosiphon promiscuus]